jgi:hypothetical protein
MNIGRELGVIQRMREHWAERWRIDDFYLDDRQHIARHKHEHVPGFDPGRSAEAIERNDSH